MADIEIYDEHATGFSMRLIGLQGGDDILYDRQVMWYVNDVLHDTVTIAQGEITEGNTSGGASRITGLKTNAYHYVFCTVWKIVDGKDPEKVWTSVTRCVSLGTPITGMGIADFSIWQKGLTEEDYQTACIKMHAEVDMSDTIFYVYDNLSDEFYRLDVTWDSDTLIGTAEFGPITIMGEHEFELHYLYTANYALGYTVTFHTLYPPLVENLDFDYAYRGLIFSWDYVGETGINYALDYWDDKTNKWVVLNNDTDVRSLPTNWDGASYLDCGRTYLFGVRTRYKGWSTWSERATIEATVPPAIPTGGLTASDDSTLIFEYGVEESTYIDYFMIELFWYGERKETRRVNINSTDSVFPSGAVVFSNLSTGEYYVRCSTFRNGVPCFKGNGSTYYYSKDVILIKKSKITPWSWQEGWNTDRGLAYQALTNNGSVDEFKHTVWNELCDKVKEALEAETGGQWDDTFASYEDTLMTADDRNLTAKRFNSLRKNVGNKEATGIDDKIIGNEVIGEEFITITEALNAFINRLNTNS